MNSLIWNYRGAGKRQTVREVLALSKANIAKLFFLCETRQVAGKMEKLRRRLGLKGFYGLNSSGLSGGLALYWDESLIVTVLDSCQRYIDVSVEDRGGDKKWQMTFVHGERRVENRYKMWYHLTRLRGVSQEPWPVCGDFNETLWQHEHMSRTLRSESQMEAFRDFLLLCELEDLGFSGVPLHTTMANLVITMYVCG